MRANTRSFIRNAVLISMAVVLIMLCSLEGSYAATKPKKVYITPTSATLTVGQSKTIKVKKVSPSRASKAVYYKTSNKAIATVSTKGVVKAKKPGKVTITVTSKKNKKARAKAVIAVKAKPLPQKKSLVVYFSQGSNIVNPYKLYDQNKSDYDALAGASILKNDSGKIVGDVGLVADWIAGYLKTTTYSIHVTDVVNVDDPTLGYEHTENPRDLYPFSQSDTQKYFRKYEQPQGINPPITSFTDHDPNLADYDVIYLGFPNWDGEPPHAVYTFLDENKDVLDGKTIAVFSTGHYRRNGFAEASMIIQAKLPKSHIVSSMFLRGQAELKNENRATTKSELNTWLNSIKSEVAYAKPRTVTEDNAQKELAKALVGKQVTAYDIEEQVGKWTSKHADTNGCARDVASMRFFYDGFVIYTRPVGIAGDDIRQIESQINDNTLYEVFQIQ